MDRRTFLGTTIGGGITSTVIGSSGVAATTAGDIFWEFETGDHVQSSPTVVGGIIYVGSDDGTLYAVEAETGTEQWTFETGDSIQSSPTVVDDIVYFGSQDNILYAVDTASGEEIWRFDEPSNQILTSPTVIDDTVYIGADDNTLYAVDSDTGTQTWEFSNPEGSVSSSPIVIDGIVYVGAMDTKLYAVDSATGKQQWEFETVSTIRSSPTLVDETVYISTGATLDAVDAETGQQEWSYTVHDDHDIVGGSSPTIEDEIVCFGSSDALYAVDAASGEEEWVYEQPTGQVFSSPTIASETVFVGSWAGGLYAVNKSTGEEEWSFTQPIEGTHCSPTVVDGIVFIGTRSGTLYAVDAGIDGSSEDSRVALRTLGYHDGQEQSIDISTSDQDGFTTMFQRASEETGILTYLAGASIVGGVSYYAYRSFQTDAVPTNEPENNIVDDPTPVVDSYSDIDLGDVVETTDKLQIQSAITDQQSIWVITPRRATDETLATEQISAFVDGFELWEKLGSDSNLISVYGFGTDPLPWAAVEQANYPALAEKANDIEVEELIVLLQQICDALHQVHRYGTIYQNLTTESVLYRNNKEIQLRGILDEFDDYDQWYNAPEEFDGESTEQSTVYRIGLIAYELFTGELPYETYPDGDPKEAIESANMSESASIDQLPLELTDEIVKALSKESGHRHETVLHLRDSLSAISIQ